jgi:AcrR family transcriptional regulator
MVIRQRATHVEDKQERREHLLDACECLLCENPERVVSVSEVAERAGLAKGTVYLYFPSKEELLLALHQRHGEDFFRELIALLEGPGPVDFDAVMDVARRLIIDLPTYLPLAGLCFGTMEKSLPDDASVEFKARMAELMGRAGAGLERHFPALAAGDGAALLTRSYAMIVGLWQMLHPRPGVDEKLAARCSGFFPRDYATEVESGLRALWLGTQAMSDAAATSGSTNPKESTP